MNTTENNKLIAEFMELSQKPNDDTMCRVPDYSAQYVLNPVLIGRNYSEWADRYTDENYNTGYELGYHDLEYHTSWDWLMPVVEKIETTCINEDNFNVVIQNNKCFIESAFNGDFVSFEEDNKLISCYMSVVDFIKWYNQQNAG